MSGVGVSSAAPRQLLSADVTVQAEASRAVMLASSKPLCAAFDSERGCSKKQANCPHQALHLCSF
eukprot:5329869-Amphidinium_carterae.1